MPKLPVSLFSVFVVLSFASVPVACHAYVFDRFEYSVDEGNVTIMRYLGSASDLVVPNVLDEKPVVSIADRAFQDKTNLVHVTIEYGITMIPRSAFEGCRNLVSVSLPTSVISIGPRAFANCRALESIQLPFSLQRIGEAAFVSCSNLTNIFIPSNVLVIGKSAFLSCQNLVSVYMPAGLASLGDSAFQGCFSLEKIFIPKDVSTIGEKAFYKCYSLEAIEVARANENYESVDGVLFNESMTRLLQFPFGRGGSYRIPDGVTRIDNCAFAQSDKLTSIIIPASVTELLNRTFDSCELLTRIYYLGEPPQLTGNDVYAYTHPELATYYIEGTAGWDNTFADLPTVPFVPWGNYVVFESEAGRFVDTGDWIGWLEVSGNPWIWSVAANGWLYMEDEVVEAGHGWVFLPELMEETPGLWLYRMAGTDWGWSYGLGKWLYVGEESLESGSGWVYLL